MADLILYGASDDLIEVMGLIEDELNPPYDKPVTIIVKVDDAIMAQIHVEYAPDGTWKLLPLYAETPGGFTNTFARGEGEPDDEFGCPGYSDRLRLHMGDIEARRINLSMSKTEPRFRSASGDDTEADR